MLFRSNWTIHKLTREKGLAYQPTDILAAIEAELGDAGRSLRATCIRCTQNHLQTLSNETSGTRTIETYCNTCKALTTLTNKHISPQEVPWTASIIEDFPKVPDNPEFRLSGKISMPELKYIIRHLALGKAPGPIGQLPAEVWRQAPDQVLEIVLNTVNDALSGKQQPDFWKGGRISFLLKKQELQLLKNWRPITLLELSYKIFSAIITKRLQRIAEYYHIYDESQEGFRQGRSTRRQIERITQILHAQRRSKKPIYIAYVDFSNAFNSEIGRAHV